VLDNELNGGIALNDGRRASEHRHCTGLRPECAKSEGTQHDAHSCRSEVFPDQISVPFMGKRIAAKFKPSGITTILESDDSRVKPLIGEQRTDLLADALAKILLSCGARGTLPNPIARGTLRHRRRANPRVKPTGRNRCSRK
jgi:hypothetical protein